MSSIFSTEIYERIIDAGQDDPSFLENCALVCTDWVPRSRSLRFGILNLGTDNLGPFLDLFRDRSEKFISPALWDIHLPTLFGSVSTLRLHFVIGRELVSRSDWRDLLYILDRHRMTFVQSLYLGVTKWFPTRDSFFHDTLASVLPRITSLDISDVRFPKATDAFNFVAKFRSLTHLKISNWFGASGNLVETSYVSPSLSSVDLYVTERESFASLALVEAISNWLMSAPGDQLPRITSLCVVSITAPQFSAEALSGYVGSLGVHLETLTLHVHRRLCA
jgi:hypothetical protein